MNLANVLSYSRIILSVAGWVFALVGQLRVLGIILIIAGITDAADGWVARRLGMASEHGARLDSLADAIILISAIFWVIFFTPIVINHPWIAVPAISAQLLCYLVALIKYRRIVALHLYSSKVMALVAYVFIVHAFLFGYSFTLLVLAAAAVLLSGLEELFILLTRKNPPTNLRSAFF